MNSKLVSIIVPCCNQAQFLPEALQSVLEQTYSNWECIIVNDGSSDNTHEVAQEWLAKNARFKYIQKENGGLSSARNAGLDVAIGEYIQFLDSDDFLLPTKLELSIALTNDYKAEVVVSNFKMFTNTFTNTIEPFCILKAEYLNYNSVLFQWDVLFSIPIHCGFFEMNLFKAFRFPLELKAKEDWIMWISIFKNNPKSFYFDNPLALYRTHVCSMTKDKELMQLNYFAALKYLRNSINKVDYDNLIFTTITRLNNNIIKEKIKYNNLKHSNTYKVGLKQKKYLQKLNLLRFAKFFLNLKN